MTTQYDQIADQYRKSTTLPVRELMEDVLQHYVGDVTGKAVLDLACGGGQFTRRYKQRGAVRVVGVDIA
jgi:toxoflavin synthase